MAADLLLWEPESYQKASQAERQAIIGRGGCGAGDGLGDCIVPDTIWFLSIHEACKIHDWMYAHGKTIADKEAADRVFLNNMLRIIDANTSWRWLRYLRKRRAWKYYLAVAALGGPAFWKGKQ